MSFYWTCNFINLITIKIIHYIIYLILCKTYFIVNLQNGVLLIDFTYILYLVFLVLCRVIFVTLVFLYQLYIKTVYNKKYCVCMFLYI